MDVFDHISSKDNTQSILDNGIRCDEEGYIYLLTDAEIQEPIWGTWVYLTDIIAVEQVGLKDYSIFQVYPEGILSKIEEDNVAEFSSSFQKRINQESIHKDHIELIEDREVNFDDYKKYKFCYNKGVVSQEYREMDLDKLWEDGKLPLPFTSELEQEMKEYYNQLGHQK